MIIFPCIPFREGRFMRRLAVEEGQRRLRAGGGRIPALPGGPGWPSDPTTGVCLGWLDADSERRGNPAGVISSEVTCWPGSTALGSENAAVARREATRPGSVADGGADRDPSTPRAFWRAATPRARGAEMRKTRAHRAAGSQTLGPSASFTVTPSAICATHSDYPGAEL